MNIVIEPFSQDHVDALVSGLSAHVKNELLSMYPNMSIEDIVSSSARYAKEVHTAFVDGQLLCMWGVTVASELSDTARPWLIPHNTNLTKYKKVFLPASRKWVKHLLTKYKALENFGSSENKRAVRWLQWLGFKIVSTVEHKGSTYIVYRLERE